MIRLGCRAGKGLFNDVEIVVPNAVARKLPGSVSQVLCEQIDHARMIQRPCGTESNNCCYRRGGRVPESMRHFRFLAVEGMLLASAQLADPGLKQRILCDVWVVNGRLFSLKFNVNICKL